MTSSVECPGNRVCLKHKCVDPCPGLCGINGVCQTENHVPSCKCSEDYFGDPYIECKKYLDPVIPPNICEVRPHACE